MSQGCQRHRLLQHAPTVLALALLASGCAPFRPGAPSEPAASEQSSTSQQGVGAVIVQQALAQVGAPYRYGGADPARGFDCSGLVNYVFRDMLDLRLPRSSRELAQVQGPRLERERLASGDLVFFGSGREVSHVGIYVGEGRFVHAPSSGGTVRLDRLDGPYWVSHYSGAKRVLD